MTSHGRDEIAGWAKDWLHAHSEVACIHKKKKDDGMSCNELEMVHRWNDDYDDESLEKATWNAGTDQ